MVDAGEVSVRGIQGAGGGGGRSFVDLICLKLAMKNYLLETWLNELQIKPETKVTIRRVLRDHDSFRTNCGKDLTWQGGWDKADIKVFEFIKDLSLP
jgi:hypothetical protein